MAAAEARFRAALRFRKLMQILGKSNNHSSSLNFTILSPAEGDDESSDDGVGVMDTVERLMEEIAYNRATAEIGANFAMAFTVLGVCTIFINIIILAILTANRRLVLQQVFYLLIINFAIIDTLKGVCLASHALRFILPPGVFGDRKVLGTKIDQHVFVFFRLFNLATVFNLLMITLNEYAFIRFPLRYHQIVKRKSVVILVLIAWAISIAFTIASSLAKGKDETVFIATNSTFLGRTSSNETAAMDVRRSQMTKEMDLHSILMFALTGFCLFSLLVVLICYVTFFNIIRKIQKHDNRMQADANPNRRASELSITDLENLDERKIKRQLMKRYKYVLVIGSVILVYMLYLISYSTIQILQHVNLNPRSSMMTSEKMRSMLITRWILLLLCGLHSAIQPTCYFRMREFRGIVLRLFVRCPSSSPWMHRIFGGGSGRHWWRRAADDRSSAECCTPNTPPINRCQNYKSITEESAGGCGGSHGAATTTADREKANNGAGGKISKPILKPYPRQPNNNNNNNNSVPKQTIVRYHDRKSIINPIMALARSRQLRHV